MEKDKTNSSIAYLYFIIIFQNHGEIKTKKLIFSYNLFKTF